MLRVNNLVGFGAGAAGDKVQYSAVDTDINTNSPSFTCNVGSYNSADLMIAAISCEDDGVPDDAGWSVVVTINGDATTEVFDAQDDNAAGCGGAILGYATGITGSGDVTVACTLSGFAGTMDGWNCVLFRIVGGATIEAAGSFGALDTSGAIVGICASGNGDGGQPSPWGIEGSTPSPDSSADITTIVRDLGGSIAIDNDPPSCTDTDITMTVHAAAGIYLSY